MAPANRTWIRNRMAVIRRMSGIAFSEEIFLSILICLVAKNKHLVLHTYPDLLPELKSTIEQHCMVVFGLSTAVITCHGQQTRAEFISAVTGRQPDVVTQTNLSTPSAQYQYRVNNPSGSHHHAHHSSQGHSLGTQYHHHHQHGSLFGHHSNTYSTMGGGGSLSGEPSGVTFAGKRIAQAIILDGLENASQDVYAVLQEIIINKAIIDRNRYNFPDAILIAVFNTSTVPNSVPKQLDWDELSKRMRSVTVSNDMVRYIRDVIVGVRTHEAVHGGLTARAALDLEIIMKTLAVIFQTIFVTPDLLMIAAEKVFSHRLQLKSAWRARLCPPEPAPQSDVSTVSSASSPSSLLNRSRQGVFSSRRNEYAPGSESQATIRQSHFQSRNQDDSTGSEQSFVIHSETDEAEGDDERYEEDAASFVELSDTESSSYRSATGGSTSDHAQALLTPTQSRHKPLDQQKPQSPSSQLQQQYYAGETGEQSYGRRQPTEDHAEGRDRGEIGYQDGNDVDAAQGEPTASDIVREVLRTVYPPI
ncbi:hypothetical protein BGW38_002295 [Lunasporangiospora selenospora]|uniref:Magnesium chelatase n=1 Tax=Lunasporangiospora selenospora TaxID=979761 RepID=A0A9P6FT18_9FUNG|nr:hypothetical protein BGW38_002295 [Lunasporangiospora selenospora]